LQLLEKTMNTSTTASPANTSATTTGAQQLNQLALLSPQRFPTPTVARKTHTQTKTQTEFADADLHSNPPIRTLEQVVEVTYGVAPQVLIRRAASLVMDTHLRAFIHSVMAERDVNRVLTLLRDDAPRYQRLPIDTLRAAAQTGSQAALAGPRARDTLYVAILISGIEHLLGQTVQPPYSSGDVIRSVVREALRRLASKDEALATDLRNCLGWGNQDEMNDPAVQRMQQRVRLAVQSLVKRMGLSFQRSQRPQR
jgi:hypothetical protein